MRVLLVIAVLLVGYDAIVHQGAYTRNLWTSLTALTNSALEGARESGRDLRDETRPD